MNVKLKGIFFNKTKKTGEPYINRNGSPFTMVNIVSENGGKASCYCEDIKHAPKLAIMKNWKSGDTVDIEITESNGFKNFDLPKKMKAEPERSVEEIAEKEGWTVEETKPIYGKDPDEPTPDPILLENIPF